MGFDIRQWLEQHNIEYVERGPNVAKGNINIQCPFCGVDDPSHHMGIDVSKLWYGCWRNPQHRGKSIERLMSSLGGFSIDHAYNITGRSGGKAPVDLTAFEQAVDSLSTQQAVPVKHVTSLEYPLDFKKLYPSDKLPRMFATYLKSRGFRKEQLKSLDHRYRLKYAYKGEWADRIIFPVFFSTNGMEKLVTWTGRSIYHTKIPRYKTLSEERSIMNIKDTVYNLNRAGFIYARHEPPKFMVICEGPFDVIKLDFYAGADTAVVGLYSNSMTTAQRDLIRNRLHKLGDKPIVIVLLDKSELENSLRIQKDLGYDKTYVEFLDVAKDPGDLTQGQVDKLIIKWKQQYG